MVIHTERRSGIRIISARKATRYEKASTKTADQDISELKRDQLGKGVRGKYLKHVMQGSIVVVLEPESRKAFPTSEAVNKALASILAFAQETQGLAGRSTRTPRRRVAA